MTGFKTLKRSRDHRQRRQPRRRRHPDDRSRRHVARPSRSRPSRPSIQAQSGERSFTIPTESVTNLPIASRSFTQLALLAPGVTTDGNQTPQRLGGGGDPNIMMDGVSTMDTGSNRPLLMMNVESIAEVKVLTSGYQAEYRPLQRRAGHGRHQERHQPVPRIGLRRRAQLGLELEQQDEHPERQSEEHREGARLGLLDRRSDRQARRHNKLFFFYAQEFSPRTRGNDVVQLPDADGRSSGRATSRRRPTTTARPYPYIRTRGSPATAPPRIRTACFADGGVLGKIPANMLYQTGSEHPQPVSRCRPSDNVPAGQTYNYTRSRGRPRASISWQPAVRARLPGVARRCARRSSTRRGISRRRRSTARFPASTTRGCRRAPVVELTRRRSTTS